jgi:hypothetical protein
MSNHNINSLPGILTHTFNHICSLNVFGVSNVPTQLLEPFGAFEAFRIPTLIVDASRQKKCSRFLRESATRGHQKPHQDNKCRKTAMRKAP